MEAELGMGTELGDGGGCGGRMGPEVKIVSMEKEDEE